MLVYNKKFILTLSTLITLFVYPVIHADFYYIDDYIRATDPYGWLNDGRFISNMIMHTFGLGNVLDLAPLFQILSVILMVFAGIVIYNLLFTKEKPVLASFIVFLFLISPFYLEQVSYRYDSFNMSLAIFLAVLSVFFLFKNTWKTTLYTTVLLTLLLLIYQPIITIFTSLSLLKLHQIFIRRENFHLKDFIIKSICIVVIALPIYSFVSKIYITGWIESHNSMVSLSLAGLQNILDNFTLLVSRGAFLQENIGSILFIASALYIIYLMAWVVKQKQFRDKLKPSILLFIISATLPILLILSALIPFIILKEPAFGTRIFVGFSIFTGFLFWCFVSVLQFFKLDKLSYGILCFPIFYLVVLSYSYGNIQKSQVEFEKILTQQILNDLSQHKSLNKVNTLLFKGNEPYAPRSIPLLEKFAYLKFFGLQNLNGHSWRGYNYFKLYPTIKLSNIYSDSSPIFQSIKENYQNYLINQNQVYKLFVINNLAIVEFSESV